MEIRSILPAAFLAALALFACTASGQSPPSGDVHEAEDRALKALASKKGDFCFERAPFSKVMERICETASANKNYSLFKIVNSARTSMP